MIFNCEDERGFRSMVLLSPAWAKTRAPEWLAQYGYTVGYYDDEPQEWEKITKLDPR